MIKKLLKTTSLIILGINLISCTKNKAELGTKDNPIKFYFLPSVDAKLVEDKSALIKSFLEANTPYKFETAIPASYVAVVEAFGTKRADIAALNTFGYLMANERYGAQAYLTSLRFGADTYKAQIITRADSNIKKVEDLQGKKFAYVDAASTSGYFMPAKLFKDKNINLKETVFAKRHDNVVTMVYQKQVDAGATFYSEPADGHIQDARKLVKTQFPDVEQKISILTLTDSIPNDPIVVGKHVSKEMAEIVIAALMKFIETPEGKEAFLNLYTITGYKRSNDETYNAVRSMLTALDKKPSELVK